MLALLRLTYVIVTPHLTNSRFEHGYPVFNTKNDYAACSEKEKVFDVFLNVF